LLRPLLELTETGGQNAQQFVSALAVFWQMTCSVDSPWNVYTGNPEGPRATDSVVSTALTRKAFVGVFVTCTPVAMRTVLLAATELGAPLLACVCTFGACAFVLPPPPQAVTVNEPAATKRMLHVNL
jgi:hypothetical protein